MATTNQPVTADQLISATVKYSNKDDSTRIYDISANVNIQNANVNSFDSGEIRMKQAESADGMEQYVGNFSSYGERSINLNLSDADETRGKSILEAVYAFMADVRANVNANPVTA